ncbi:DUF262 domain-containing protein [Methylocaldum sp. GT1BB]|jgi:hypothetical protein|uniref:DUF262 domain-containing protein n=1 Tax=Methylocaldum sp. GT1BB TaxID=3438963 RepID=UPI003DA10930
MNNSTWFEDYVEDADDLQVEEYDITAAPNDFNVLTIQSFLESGAVRIPGFQRNYVWDIGRASKLIESLCRFIISSSSDFQERIDGQSFE